MKSRRVEEDMMPEKITIEKWFGTFSTASGGSRTGIKLSRPWQSDIAVNPDTCPFCTKTEPDLSRHEDSGIWRVLENAFTPFPLHYLILPDKCWSADEVRKLGGEDKIRALIRIVTEYVKKHANKELWLFINVGFLGGQNLGHYHSHLLEPIRGKKRMLVSKENVADIRNSKLVIFENNLFKTIVGGFAAGQCFLIPKKRGVLSKPDYNIKLSESLHHIVNLGNTRFKSTQGLEPDFTILAKFCCSKFEYATYIPALGNWWGCSQMMAIMEGMPFILAWPHEKTFEYLMV